MHTHICNTYTHANIHTYIHTHMHTYIHIHVYTHTHTPFTKSGGAESSASRPSLRATRGAMSVLASLPVSSTASPTGTHVRPSPASMATRFPRDRRTRLILPSTMLSLLLTLLPVGGFLRKLSCSLSLWWSRCAAPIDSGWHRHPHPLTHYNVEGPPQYSRGLVIAPTRLSFHEGRFEPGRNSEKSMP
jgi:hypothetical protein